MVIGALTGNTQQIANQIGVPTVTTNQMASKVNGISANVYHLLNGTVMNIAVVLLIIAVIGLIGSAVFHKKGIKFFIGSIIFILIGIVLIKTAPELIGWAINISGSN